MQHIVNPARMSKHTSNNNKLQWWPLLFMKHFCRCVLMQYNHNTPNWHQLQKATLLCPIIWCAFVCWLFVPTLPCYPSFSSWSRHMPSGCRHLPDTSQGSLRSLCPTSPNSSAKAHQEGSYTQVEPPCRRVLFLIEVHCCVFPLFSRGYVSFFISVFGKLWFQT